MPPEKSTRRTMEPDTKGTYWRCGLKSLRTAMLFVTACLFVLMSLCGCNKESGEKKSMQESTKSICETADLPRVIDLGRGKCVPCKRMAPILAELKQEYEGRAIIDAIDLGDPGGRELARMYRVRLIPTQIFLDSDGNEVWRHEGFLPKEDIVAKLREMGVSDE
jgi:thioredoxin 1